MKATCIQAWPCGLLPTNCKAHSPVSMAGPWALWRGGGRVWVWGGSNTWTSSMLAHGWESRRQYFPKGWEHSNWCLTPLPSLLLPPLQIHVHLFPWNCSHSGSHHMVDTPSLKMRPWFISLNKQSQRCSGAWGTHRFWGLSRQEPFSIPSSNKQHFRAQEAFRGHVPFSSLCLSAGVTQFWRSYQHKHILFTSCNNFPVLIVISIFLAFFTEFFFLIQNFCTSK